MSGVHAHYFTDPACPWSWGLEPVVRRLEVEFGAEVRITFVMGGLAREFGPPAEQARTWLQAAGRSGMPVDPLVWWEGGLRSSHPACLAVVAAREQGREAAMLRALREAVLCRGRRADGPEALAGVAREVDGLDVERFRRALGSSATLEALGADFERARGRELPTLAFDDDGGPELVGLRPWAEYAGAARAAGARAAVTSVPDVLGALRRYGAMATPEVAEVCDLPGPRAAAELWRLAVEWRVRPERCGTGELWHAA